MKRLRLSVAAALLIGLASAPAQAQLAVEPQEVSVTVEQHEATTRTVTLSNTGTEPLAFCLSFERPLQRSGGEVRLDAEALGGACGEYGEVLALVDEGGVPEPWSPYGLTMTADGRLFAADASDGQTFELDAALNYVHHFAHPEVGELAPFPKTRGVTYNADTGTLWWLNVEGSGFDLYRALLLEGDLNGVPTGRRIELPIGVPEVPPDERVTPAGLSYNAIMGRYYYTDSQDGRSEILWAVDTLGNAASGYPVGPEAYPNAIPLRGLNTLTDTSAGEGTLEGKGLRIELAMNPSGGSPPRLGVIGRYGGDTAPEAEPLETPLVDPLPGTDGSGNISGEPVRSVLDPNGVLYYPWSGFDGAGVAAVRPHPLPPSWLVVEAWRGTLPRGESQSIELTFRPGSRAVGEYTVVLQAFEAESGAAVEVPLTMTVTQGTDAEGEAPQPEEPSLAVYPNPASGAASVALMLDAASEVRIAVYDVLGRQVVLLHEGRLEAGTYRFTLNGSGLPAGVYLVRVEHGERRFAERITVVR